jgi:hypothetical protein
MGDDGTLEIVFGLTRGAKLAIWSGEPGNWVF